jgi:hypothetical protein
VVHSIVHRSIVPLSEAVVKSIVHSRNYNIKVGSTVFQNLRPYDSYVQWFCNNGGDQVQTRLSTLCSFRIRNLLCNQHHAKYIRPKWIRSSINQTAEL